MIGRFLSLVLLALCAAACVTRADFEKVRREQQAMRAAVADTQVAVDKIRRHVDTLRTNVEDQPVGRNGAALTKLESRVASLELRLGPMGGVGSVPVGGGVAPQRRTDAAVIASRREERRLASEPVNATYARGFQLYKQGQTGQSIEQFRKFLRTGADSELADNAQYWIGEAYYGGGDYNRAIIELNEVLLKYPQGDQVPGALLALATAFANSGDPIDARLILQKLISAHSASEEARVGRQQLQALTE